MNSFLAGLLDRAEGRAPTLERRPRALFEPRPAGDSRPLEALEQDETVVSEAPRHRARSSEPVEPGQRGEAQPSAERIEQSRKAGPSSVPERNIAEAARSEPRGALTPTRESEMGARTVASEGVHPTHQTTRIAGVVERHETLVTVTKLVDARHPAERPASPRESRPDASLPKSDAHRRAEAPPAVNRTTVIVERSQMIPVPTPRPSPRAAASSAVRLAQAQAAVGAWPETRIPATPAPVQITIGRVEVRAVPEKRERSHTKAPAAPRLSLDEYLRQRSGATR